MSLRPPPELNSANLDPADWDAFARAAHAALDAALTRMRTVRDGTVWQRMPASARAALREPLPVGPQGIEGALASFEELVAPYPTGNTHPRFFGWVHGGGNPAGMVAEMLAGAMNANLGGRDHAPIEVERQITRWLAGLFGFPADASGLFMTGSSLANFVAMLVARRRALGASVRRHGVGGARLAAYASAGVHGCIARAMDFMGLGSDALRLVPTDAAHRIDIAALKRHIAKDRAAGIRPFAVVGSAGTVDVGAVDDLDALADIAAEEGLWFHVDGALGALAVLHPGLAPRFAGIGRADSLALDFHKLGQVPYDAGFLLVRHPREHFDTFAAHANYLQAAGRGLAAGEPWPTSFGPDLSRGFRALKVWMTLKTHGTARLGEVIGKLCGIATDFAELVRRTPGLELMAPAGLNIVCFRHLGPAPDLDALNQEIVFRLQESGIAAPSTTRLGGRLVIRAAFVNHRTTAEDARILLDATRAEAARILGEKGETAAA